MSKRRGMRNDVRIDPLLKEFGAEVVTYALPPQGLPKKSPLAECGFYGSPKASAKREANRGGIQKPRTVGIGMNFPLPPEGSFNAPDLAYGWRGAQHGEFDKAAYKAARAEIKAKVAAENRAIADLGYKVDVDLLRPRQNELVTMVVEAGLIDTPGLWAEVAVCAAMLLLLREERQLDPERQLEHLAKVKEEIEKRTRMLAFRASHVPQMGIESPRRPAPLDMRESTSDSLKKGTHGASTMAPRVFPYASDGVTPPCRQEATTTIHEPVEVVRSKRGKGKRAVTVEYVKTRPVQIGREAERFLEATNPGPPAPELNDGRVEVGRAQYSTYLAKHQERLANLRTISKEAKSLRPHGLEKP